MSGSKDLAETGEDKHGRADEDMQSDSVNGACIWIRDRKSRVKDWEGEKRSEKQSHTKAVKSLQVGKARFGEVPDTASKG